MTAIHRWPRVLGVTLLISGSAAALAVLAVLIHPWDPVAFDGRLDPSLLSLAAGCGLAAGALLMAVRRTPAFWTAWGAGVLLILASLDYWDIGSWPAAGFLGVDFRSEALFPVGLGLFAVSLAASRRMMLRYRRFLAALIVGSTAAAAAFGAMMARRPTASELSYADARSKLESLIHPELESYVDDVDEVIDGILENPDTDDAEKEAQIESLSKRIEDLEAELARYDARNDEEGRIVVTLDGEEVHRVLGYAAAMGPDVPMVRDYAVALAASFPGAYGPSPTEPYRPGAEGMAQILAIHRRVSTEWTYITDPAFVGPDYVSPAYRTLAAGLVGDCDDYAVLTASLVEAIGGKTRIVHGHCAEGCHAWPEVYIGPRDRLGTVEAVIRRAYPSERLGCSVDGEGGAWLSLDWELGRYSCGDDPVVAYQRLGAAS